MQSSRGDVGAGSSADGWLEAEQEVPAPPYHAISQDPVIPYPVATMGRLVLPPAGFDEPSSSSRTLPAVLRRIQRSSANIRAGEEAVDSQEFEASNAGGASDAQLPEQLNMRRRPVKDNESVRSGNNEEEDRAQQRLEVRGPPHQEVDASGKRCQRASNQFVFVT
jgi:hypothetical protein